MSTTGMEYKFGLRLCLILRFILFTNGQNTGECHIKDNLTLICNYIPTVIPHGIHDVRIVDFKSQDERIIINSTTFADSSWNNINSLQFSDKSNRTASCIFKSKCFINLKNLHELKIHMSWFWLENGVFDRLPSVHTLDMSQCVRLNTEDILEQLSLKTSVPNLRKLMLSSLGMVLPDANNKIDLPFVESILPRKITHLDISGAQIAYFNVTSIMKNLPTLESLNLSSSNVGQSEAEDTGIYPHDVSHIKMLDFSFSTLPKSTLNLPPGKIIVSNRSLTPFNWNNGLFFIAIETWNLSSITPVTNSFLIKNCTALITHPPPGKMIELVFSNNNLRHIDINITCPMGFVLSLRKLDLSHNQMDMINPTIISCMKNLETVDLSNNNLCKMVADNTNNFKLIFLNLTKLESVNLSQNQLTVIPLKLFETNFNIRDIDLSGNQLQQVTMTLSHLKNLRLLNLRSNNIKILDADSIRMLNAIVSPNNTARVDLAENPISCSQCDAKPFIEWILTTNNIKIDLSDVTCINEAGVQERITMSTLEKVQHICNRRTIAIATITAVTVAIIVIIMFIIIVIKKRKAIRKEQKRNIVLNRLRKGEGQYEFVAFLSYSSRDDFFVDRYILNQLNNNLKLMTGIDRELICSGDKNLRPGLSVLSETIRCIDRASVMIAIVTNNFCFSSFCMNEFEQAYLLRKPIILMFKDQVEETLMSPIMKQLFQKNVRILWTLDNGHYVMKSSWQHVCTAILDNIQVN